MNYPHRFIFYFPCLEDPFQLTNHGQAATKRAMELDIEMKQARARVGEIFCPLRVMSCRSNHSKTLERRHNRKE